MNKLYAYPYYHYNRYHLPPVNILIEIKLIHYNYTLRGNVKYEVRHQNFSDSQRLTLLIRA